MKKFTVINKERSRIKVFEPFENVSKPSISVNAMMIPYGYVYKRSSKPVMKGSRVGKRPVFLEVFSTFPIYIIIFINIFFPNPSKFS